MQYAIGSTLVGYRHIHAIKLAIGHVDTLHVKHEHTHRIRLDRDE